MCKAMQLVFPGFFVYSLDIAGVFQGKLQAGLSSSTETAAARKAFLVRELLDFQ